MSIDRLTSWMAGAGVEATCVSDPLSIGYLTGFFANPHERVMALAVRRDGATLVLPTLERDNAVARAAGVSVVSYQDGDDALGLLREVLGRPATIAVERDHLSLARAEAIGAIDSFDAGEVLLRLRAVKSSTELDLLQVAATRTDEVTERVLAELRPGMTEREVASRLDVLIREAGCAPAFGSIVQAGPNSAMPHLGPGERRLQAGDLVLLDFGCRYARYNGDTTRMAVIGKPDARIREVYAAVLGAHDAGIAAIRAGALTGAVDAAARRVLAEAGLGEYFIHRLGHGLGLDAHEAPNLTPGATDILEEGNVVTVEPGVYIPGWGGIRIEDDVVVERDGARLLTNADRALKVIPVQPPPRRR